MKFKNTKFETQIEVQKELSQYKRRRSKDILIKPIGTAHKEKICNRLRSNLGQSIKLNVNVGDTEKYLGCSISEFKKYFETLFYDGMTWENRNYNGWHIEHIKPLFLFDLDNEEEKYKACHYTNLRPMWNKDHKVKTKQEKRQYKKYIKNPEHIKK